MKTNQFPAKKLSLIVLLLTLLGCAANPGSNRTAEKTPIFDAQLAEKLGADQYGMKSYTLVILKTGPKDAVITDKDQRALLFKGHFSNMQALEKSGKLIMAGPFSTKNSLGYRGLFLLDTTSLELAQSLLQNDPTIKAQIFELELLPFYGSAAIPTLLDVHKKIAKESP